MSNWIKVSDRLPKEREQVLIRYWNGQIHTGAIINGKWHSNWNDYDIDLATHWLSIEFNAEEEFKRQNRAVCGGRGKGKMMSVEKWLESLPKEMREKVIVVKASDPIPELKGNKRPMIVDYDTIEQSEPSWKLWEKIKSAIRK